MADRRKHNNGGSESGVRERIHRLLRQIDNRFESASGKACVSDYARLLQLERELDENERTYGRSIEGALPFGKGLSGLL